MNRATRSIAYATAAGAALTAGVLFPAAASAGVVIVAQPGVTTPIEIKTLPSARCRLGASPLGDNALVAYSDPAGVVRYEVSEPPKASGAVPAILDCRTAKQDLLEGLTVVAGKSKGAGYLQAARPQAVTRFDTAATIGVLPGTPPGFDVTRASDGALAALGYPARPDHLRNPQAYAMWRLLVTTQGLYVPPHVMLESDIQSAAGPNVGATQQRLRRSGTVDYSWNTSAVDSGVQVVTPFVPGFTFTTASWYVPSVTSRAPVSAASPPESSLTWTGLDGWTSRVMERAQAGTQQAVMKIGNADFTSYQAWFAFGGPQYVVTAMLIAPGDRVFVEVNVNDITTASPSADIYIYNLNPTRFHGTSVHVATPNPGQFFAQGVDWFESRPRVHGVLEPMPGYSPVNFSDASAYTADHDTYNVDGSNPLGRPASQIDWFMTSDGSLGGTEISGCVFGTSTLHCVRVP